MPPGHFSVFRPRNMSPANDYQQLSLKTLETALVEVPGYDSWRRYDPGPRVPLDKRYAALPILTKGILRDQFPYGFIPRGRDLNRALAAGDIVYAQTSGSTADQVTIVFHPPWWEASERAAWRLNAHARRVADGFHREAVLASPRCVGPGHVPRPLTMAERTIGRHLYLNQHINPAAWNERDLRRMVGELNEFAPAVLEGDPAYLAAFASRIADLGIAVFQPQLIFLTYSYPSRIYLHQIRQVFTAPQASSYGSTETGHVFMECEHGRLHQNIEHCRVDMTPWTIRQGGPLRNRMLVTVFRNPWFVALRFDIGDVALRDERGPCPCGRNTGVTLAAIAGRISDVTFTAAGRAVTVADLDDALAAIPGLNGWQLFQPEPGRLQLSVLAAAAAANGIRRQARDVLHTIYGDDLRMAVARVNALRNEPSGKFRFCRTAFPVDTNALWQGME